MKKILFVLYQPYKWLFFVPFLVVSTLVFGITAALLAIFVSPKIGSFIGGVLWARINSYLTPMFVSVTGREKVDKKQSYVIVSNHQSHYDIFVLYGWVGVDFKWVMKHELRKIPGLGIGCEKIGHIFIDRSSHEKALASINSAKEKIVNGTSVIFFPEGTRSQTGELGQFKKGAFKMAIDLGLPVLPVTLLGTKDILPSNTMNLLPGRVKMIIGNPIPIEGYSDDNILELMGRARETMLRNLPGVEGKAIQVESPATL